MTHACRDAVILAAGLGMRLKQRGELIPKGFLDAGGGPIIEESLAHLRAANISRVVIVTGHQAEWYERLRSRSEGFVETIYNPYYGQSGSLFSLACARERVTGSFLLLDSDLIYEPRALTACLEFPAEDVVLLSDFTDSDDEVYVETKDGRMVNMSKDRAQLGPVVAGEFIGISRISPALYWLMIEEVRDPSGQRPCLQHYETDGMVFAAQRHPIYCHKVPELIWTEIDHEDHLLRARQKIFPALRSKASSGPLHSGVTKLGKIRVSESESLRF